MIQKAIDFLVKEAVETEPKKKKEKAETKKVDKGMEQED